MARRTVTRRTRKHSRKHSRRCIFRYTRKQHRKYQRRQRGGVSEDIPTVKTVAGTPLANDAIAVVTGKPPMSVKEYELLASEGKLAPVT